MGQLEKTDRELYGLQVLRGFAAVAVVIHHALQTSMQVAAGPFSPMWLTTVGAVGVDVFFVLSGFIIVHASFAQDRTVLRPGQFFLKRMLRIFPLYWICTLAMVAIVVSGRALDADLLVTSLMLLPGDKLIGLAWTLSYELYFYALFAICLLLKDRLKVVTAVMVAIGVGLLVGSMLENGRLGLFLRDPIILEFCFGMGLALYHARHGGWRFALLPVLVCVGVICVAPLVFRPANASGMDMHLRFWIWGIPATFLVAAFVGLGRSRSVPGQFALRLGDASYAIYLTHAFGMFAYEWLIAQTSIGTIHQALVVPAVVVLCVITGILTHERLERPLLRKLRTGLFSRSPTEVYAAGA